MRLFVLWPRMDLAKGVIMRLKERAHDVVYWVGLNSGYANDFPEAVFHDYFNAWNGEPAPAFFGLDFNPPSYELISKFHKTESMVLTMMNKRFDWMSVDERRHLYYKMISYWDGVVEKLKPEAVIFSTVPHTVYDYILYELALFKNIRTIMLWSIDAVPGRLLLYEDFRKGSLDLQKCLQKNQGCDFSVADLSEEMRKFYGRQVHFGRGESPPDLKKTLKDFSLFNRMALKVGAICAAFNEGIFIERFILRIQKFLKKNIRDEYVGVQIEPDFNLKFVYIALHYQPECTTAPVGDVFADQILMIEILSSSLPEGWRIYVKEHPYQWLVRGLNFAASRYRGYYEKISKIKNTFLVPLETDSFKLMSFAQVVATVSGTVGLEALSRSKPVIIFGHPWYRDCPGVFKVDGVSSCGAAFQKISRGFMVDQKDVINFLKSVDEVAIRGYLDDYGMKYSKLDKEKNLDNISRVILETLDNSKVN